MSRPRVPDPAYGGQPPINIESRDSFGTTSPENVNRLYYDDEDVEHQQSNPNSQPPNQQYSQYDNRRPQYPYPNEPLQGYPQNDPGYDSYGTLRFFRRR